jgi:Flp pilus assembly pilin Flp
LSDLINNLVVRAYLASKREEGQTFVEYAMIAALIGVALVVALGLFATGLGEKLGDITDAL